LKSRGSDRRRRVANVGQVAHLRRVVNPPSGALFAGGAQSCYSLRRLLPSFPPLIGAPIHIQSAKGLRDRHGAAHAGSFLRERRIELDCTRAELPRVLAHEVFHFVWLRLGNAARHSWEAVLREEISAGARGELGWSAEWRKRALPRRDIALRHRRWREYCSESFCDTAAWLYSGIARHEEFTLARRFRERRRAWFAAAGERGPFSI